MTEGLLTQLRSMAAQQSKLRAFRDKVCWGRRAGAGAVGARWGRGGCCPATPCGLWLDWVQLKGRTRSMTVFPVRWLLQNRDCFTELGVRSLSCNCYDVSKATRHWRLDFRAASFHKLYARSQLVDRFWLGTWSFYSATLKGSLLKRQTLIVTALRDAQLCAGCAGPQAG